MPQLATSQNPGANPSAGAPPVNPQDQPLHEALERLERETLATERQMRDGTRYNLQTAEREYRGCGPISYFSGYTDACRRNVNAERSLLAQRERKVTELEVGVRDGRSLLDQITV